MKKLKVGMVIFLILGLVITGCSTGTSTQEVKVDYPVKPIEYIVPFSPGGGVDLVARAVAEYVSKDWGQPVNVINKPGGGGAVGAEYALKQTPKDGYTVLADNGSSTSLLESGLKNPPVKIADRIFVSRIVQDPLVFAVKTDAPWKDLQELSQWVKANPEKLTWTSVGSAGISSFAVAEWLDSIGVDYSKTPMIATKGASDSIPKVAGGHAVLAVHTVAETYAMAQAGKIRILGVQAAERSPYLPDVPTLEEQGIKGVTAKWWTGITVPAG
ncbi:MAG: tripartite tricarboxylate transporter substrate binding protein, partial [Clostridia bacterium]|nr:tripartite tricarboxylate transporter substrate binding protein [Clostridia bacterium]